METKYPMPLYPDAKSKTPLDDGHEFQDFCRPILLRYGILAVYYTSKKYQFDQGESVYGIEIKLDNWCTKSNRLSIETGEKSKAANPVYVPSGIYRTDNTWLYVHGNYDRIWVFSKKFLVQLHKAGTYEESKKPTIQSFYLPIADAEKYSVLDINVAAEKKAAA